jgi:hypothetical protein
MSTIMLRYRDTGVQKSKGLDALNVCVADKLREAFIEDNIRLPLEYALWLERALRRNCSCSLGKGSWKELNCAGGGSRGPLGGTGQEGERSCGPRALAANEHLENVENVEYGKFTDLNDRFARIVRGGMQSLYDSLA